MSKNTIKTRIINKNDITSNWALATNFVPLNGEFCIYNDAKTDTNGKQIPLIKVGNGLDNVNDLPFIAEGLSNTEIDEICGAILL